MEAAWGRMEVVGKCRAEDGCGLRAIPAGTERGSYCGLCPVCPALWDRTVGGTCTSVPLVTVTAAGPSRACDGQALSSFIHPNVLTFTESPQGSGAIPALRGYVPCPGHTASGWLTQGWSPGHLAP